MDKAVVSAWLEVDACAREMGATSHAIRARIARGLIPYRKLGGRVLIPRAELDRFLSGLPGVSADQALANIAARRGGTAVRS